MESPNNSMSTQFPANANNKRTSLTSSLACWKSIGVYIKIVLISSPRDSKIVNCLEHIEHLNRRQITCLVLHLLNVLNLMLIMSKQWFFARNVCFVTHWMWNCWKTSGQTLNLVYNRYSIFKCIIEVVFSIWLFQWSKLDIVQVFTVKDLVQDRYTMSTKSLQINLDIFSFWASCQNVLYLPKIGLAKSPKKTSLFVQSSSKWKCKQISWKNVNGDKKLLQLL